MEGSESAVNRVGRAIWTVWGYLTGTVGRYLRPEVLNEGDTVTISKGYRELKLNEEEKERNERKTFEGTMREGRQCSGIGVRAVAVRWEKGNIDADAEKKDTNKHTCASTVWDTRVQDGSSEDIDQKAQRKRDSKETLDFHLNDDSGTRKTKGNSSTEKDDSPVYTDTDIKNQDFKFPGSEKVDLDVERSEKNQEQRSKPEEEEGVDDIMRREHDGIGKEPTKKQGIELEQANECSMGDEARVQVVSVEKVMEYVYDGDKKQENVVEQRNQGTTEDENVVSKSQMRGEGLLFQLACSTREGRGLLKKDLKLEAETIENKATLIPEKEVLDVNNKETNQVTVRNVKDDHHEEFTAGEQYTSADIVEGQEEKDETQIEVIGRNVETECEILETTQMEHEEIDEKEPEPTRKMKVMFENEDDLDADLLTYDFMIKSDQLEQHKEATSEVALKVDLRQLDDTAHNHTGSQRPEVVTEQDIEGVITRLEEGTGNQTGTVKTTLKFRAEVAAVDVKKSAELETSSNEQPIAREEVARQEIMDRCCLEQGSVLEESADTRMNEFGSLKAPFIEIKSVSPEQVDETAVESIDEMPISSPDKMECSTKTSDGSITELIVKTKPSSTEQTAKMFETFSEVTGMSKNATTELKCEQAESESDTLKTEREFSLATVETTSEVLEESVEAKAPNLDNMSETPLEHQLNQDECTVQDRSAVESGSHGLQIGSTEALGFPERVSALKTPEMQKNTEEQATTDEAEIGLLDEIKAMATSSGVVKEIISGLITESEDRQRELPREMQDPEKQEQIGEFERHVEMSESNSAGMHTNVELLNNTVEYEINLEAEAMDIESKACEEIESVKKMEELIPEDEKDGSHPVVFESEASKEMSKEHEEKVVDGDVVDSNEGVREKSGPGLKRGFEKMAGDNDEDEPPVLADVLLLSQVSSLDFTVQKSRIAVKNPIVRPPKDPRTLINMASVEPLTCPHPPQPSPLKKSHIEGLSVPSKGVIGFKLPGLGAGLPAMRKTEAGRKIRNGEDAQSVTSQKSDAESHSTDNDVKQGPLPDKPKWTPPRHSGMSSPLMMAELRSKLKKTVKE